MFSPANAPYSNAKARSVGPRPDTLGSTPAISHTSDPSASEWIKLSSAQPRARSASSGMEYTTVNLTMFSASAAAMRHFWLRRFCISVYMRFMLSRQPSFFSPSFPLSGSLSMMRSISFFSHSHVHSSTSSVIIRKHTAKPGSRYFITPGTLARSHCMFKSSIASAKVNTVALCRMYFTVISPTVCPTSSDFE